MKFVLKIVGGTLIAFVVALLLVAACAALVEEGSESGAQVDEKAAEPAEPEEEPPPPEDDPTVGQIGETASITEGGQDTVDITVSDLRVETTAQTEFGRPPSNGNFLIFTVDLEAYATTSVDEYEFYVVMPDGTRYDSLNGNAWEAVELNQMLGYAELNQGEKTSGVIAFDVPNTKGELKYSPTFSEGPLVTWKF